MTEPTYPFKGQRVEPDEGGWLRRRLSPGDYCLVNPTTMADGSPLPDDLKKVYPYWVLESPNGHGCSLSNEVHLITIHEDGTLTVSPSIRISTRRDGQDVELWHGYLRRGVWSLS